MIAPHVLGGANEEAAPPETIKKAAGPPATPQESNNSKESTEIPSCYQPPPEPWGESVDGEELLNELRDTFSRHVVLPVHAAATPALWAMHTYSYQLGRVSTYIAQEEKVVALAKKCTDRRVIAYLDQLDGANNDDIKLEYSSDLFREFGVRYE